MKRTLIPLLLVAVTVGSCSKKQTFDDKVALEVATFNEKDAPKRTDPVTTLDSLAYDRETRTISYHYTLEGIADDGSIITDELREKQRDNLLRNIRSNLQLKSYKEQGTNFHYEYRSQSTGEILMTYSFSAEDYEF